MHPRVISKGLVAEKAAGGPEFSVVEKKEDVKVKKSSVKKM